MAFSVSEIDGRKFKMNERGHSPCEPAKKPKATKDEQEPKYEQKCETSKNFSVRSQLVPTEKSS